MPFGPDDSNQAADSAPLLTLWRRRVAGRALLLAVVAVILAGLVIAGQLPPGPALFALALTGAAAVLLPDRGDEDSGGAARPAPQPLGDAGLQLFADALPDPCLVLDGRSILVHRNKAAALQFPGLTMGNPISLSLRSPAVSGAIEKARQTGEPASVEMHLTVPTETWHRVTVAPLAPGEGAGRLIVTLQSLTDARRLETLRTDFVANISHELRTPLTSLLGFIDTLTGPAARDAEAREKFLGIMRNQAVRMSKLIDDLLSLSRIEMRQHVRPRGSVDLASLLREVQEGLATAAREVETAIQLDLPDGPLPVTGDRDELYEVFENLIENALKYGADGGRVDVVVKRVADRPGYGVLASVTDYGIGVDAAHVPRLTERFYRVDAESSRKKKGTGLGLAIVKHIITRHRGLLSIRSQPGRGTRVEVLLPA